MTSEPEFSGDLPEIAPRAPRELLVDNRFRLLGKVFGALFGNRLAGGGALAVYHRGEKVVDLWAGTSDKDGTRPWLPETSGVIYSASKGLSSLVIHRLADRGLIDYDAPVAQYWPEFGANGKGAVTVRAVLNHTAGLSQIVGIADSLDEELDHRLMEERLAAAPLDRLAGKPAYHALTIGWLLAGLARAVTGQDMRDLYAQELAAPLGLAKLHLGRPPGQQAIPLAQFVDPIGGFTRIFSERWLARATRGPAFARSLASSFYAGPGMSQAIVDADSVALDAQMPAVNAVASAESLAKLYAAVAGDGSVDGARLLSPSAVASFARKPSLRFDGVLHVPMMWHMGFHSIPLPLLSSGFGHVGLNGCFGWADPTRELSIALVHNRLPSTLLFDLLAFLWLVPLAARAVPRR